MQVSEIWQICSLVKTAKLQILILMTVVGISALLTFNKQADSNR